MPTAAHRSSDGPPSHDAPHSAHPSSSSSASSTTTHSATATPAASHHHHPPPPPSSSSVARHSPKPRPRPLNNQLHPYRIELLDLTPVSVSLLWSTRPPPLSAIPLEAINSQLRKRNKARSSPNGAHRSSSPSRSSARATAVSPSPTSATAATVSKSRIPAAAQASASTQPLETPISRLTEGLVATRSLNRKVTKIRLRPPPTVPAQPRRSSNGSAPSDSAHNSANDDDAWPSDDGLTAVEDEAGSASDASDSGYEASPDSRHHVTSVFKDRVSVTVNGHDWSHVLLGERGSHEAIVVIFGLEPESDYDIQFLVKAGLDGMHDAFRATLRTRADRDSSRSVEPTPTLRSSSPSPLSRLPVSAPELDVVEPPPQRLAVLQAELEATEALKASLIADVKRARKESSKQEAGLRHEIDAVKRGMDRLSATDHRSRQKVLALQELIKQTTIQTKEIHEQADIAEKEQPQWEQQDAELEVQLEILRKEVEAEEAAAQAEWDKDEAALATLDKELRSLEASAKALESERDELRDNQLASIQAEIEKVKEEAREALTRPAGARRGGAAAGGVAQRGAHRHASGPHPTANTLGQKGKTGARGGKLSSFGNRAVSGPASQFGGSGNSNNSNSGGTGFAGVSRGFMQSFGKGFRRGQNHNQQSQSFDAMAGAGFAGAGGSSQQGAMLPPGQAYVPDQAAMAMGAYGGNRPYATLDSFYAQPPQQTSQFPSGISEASQDDLYDPTLGFDPYDPSIDARRRSSLPIPTVSYNAPQVRLPASSTTTALNPANPEFVPSTGSNHASPVISKNPSASSALDAKVNATTTLASAVPAQTAVAVQSPPAGVASVEHSPTSSSRFAFPLARHIATPSISSSNGGSAPSLPTKSSSPALASPNNAHANPNNILNLPLGSDLTVPSSSGMGSSLFSMGTSGAASPFARHSPLLAQGIDASGSSMGFAGSSPRFGPMGLHGHALGSTGSGGGDDPSSSSAAFGTSSKFGPLDYDPGMDNFGPAPGLAGGLSSAPGANATAAATAGAGAGTGTGAGGLPPFSSSTMSSIFGASDTWSTPAGSHANMTPSSSSWITSSPPLGSGAIVASNSAGSGSSGVGDIWSAPTLPGMSQLRTKMSLGDLHSSSNASGSGSGSSPTANAAAGGAGAGAGAGAASFGPFASARIGLGAIGHASNAPNRSSPLASPVTAASAATAVVGEQRTEADA